MNLMLKYILYIALFAVSTFLSPARLQAQNDFASGVAKIGANNKTGTGLLVGNDKEKVFIISSYDLVSENDEIVSPVFVQLKTRMATFPATVVQVDKNQNLAVLQIELEEESNLVSFSMATDLQLHVAQSVKSIGHSNDENWEENYSNRIKKIHVQADSQRMIISARRMTGGYAGSPVFTESYEWIGMLNDINQRDAVMLKGNVILKQLDTWNIRPNLILPGFSNLKDRFYFAKTEVDQKESLPIELRNQDIFMMVQDVNIQLTKVQSRKNGEIEKVKEVKRIDPVRLKSGQQSFEFPLAKRIWGSRRYALRFDVGGQSFYSDPIRIGRPRLREVLTGIVGVGVIIGGYFITRPLPDPPGLPN